MNRRPLLDWLEFVVELGIDGLPVRLPPPAAETTAARPAPAAGERRQRARPGSSPIDRMRAALDARTGGGDARRAEPPRSQPTASSTARAAAPVEGSALERLSGLPSPGGLFGAGEAEVGDAEAPASLAAVRAELGDCERCKLHQGRTNIVFGVGNPEAELMFVGEGPGRDEDEQGEPFVGRAGKLLNDIIRAIDMRREDVYIANVVKCRPPDNRTPEADEVEACRGFLFQQLAVVRPKIVVALGRPAAETLLGRSVAISRVRGQLFDYHGAKLLPTYHPAYLLRTPAKKRDVWEDMKLVRDLLRAG